jgi:hypothetical protein
VINVLARLYCRLYCRLRASHGPWTHHPDRGTADERWFECLRCGHLATARPDAGERGVPWTDQVAAMDRREGSE